MRKPLTQKGNTQLDKFKAAARELETDDDEDRFNEKLKAVAKPKAKDGDKKD